MNVAAVRAGPLRPAVAALLDACGLPAADLTDGHMQHFLYCGAPSAPVAIVGVELCGGDALLRSLVVTPARRGEGLAVALVEHAEAYARECGARSMYLLTETATAFFRRCGYADAARDGAPDGIRATREFADLCPASAAFLVKRLDDGASRE